MFQNKNNSELETNILFEGVSTGQLLSFINPKNIIGRKEGDVIFQKGDPADQMFLLIEGIVKLKFTEPDGTNIYINRTGNSFFGETELLEKTPRKSSAVADTDCRMYTFNFNELKTLVKADKKILQNLYNNKTIDFSEKDFFAGTKDLADHKDDLSDLAKTTEKLSLNFNEEEKESGEKTGEITPANENIFDNIITKEETEEEITDESTADNEETEEKDSVIENYSPEPIEENIGLNDEDIVPAEIQTDEPQKPADVTDSFFEEDIAAEPGKENEEIQEIIERPKADIAFTDYYEKILKATQNIFSRLTLDETADAIAEYAAELVNAEGGVLYLAEKENEELKAKILSDNSIKDVRIKFSDGLQGIAVLEKRTIIIENPKKEKNFNPVIEDLTGIKIKNALYYPLFTKSEEPVAVLELYNSSRGKFDSREIELLNAISQSILKAIDNSKLVEIFIQQKKILTLGEISALMSEDISGSLLKIKHYTSLIKKKANSPEINKALDLQIEQVNSIENFLKFTDAYAHGKNVIVQSTIKVSDALTQVLSFLAEYVESRNVVIYKKTDADAIINADINALYQACYQIAKNACDAMPEDGKIYVTTEKDGDFIKIKFRDTGIGISETIKAKLFKPFTTYGKKNKAGLGLAIAEKIISYHGGYILADSVIGEGATFTIALPIVF